MGWALPHGEFRLDVIALVGVLRYQEQRSIPQIHQELQRRGIYEELAPSGRSTAATTAPEQAQTGGSGA